MLKYAYPEYRIDLTEEMLTECVEIGIRLLNEVGIVVKNKRFLDMVKGKEGIRIEGERVSA